MGGSKQQLVARHSEPENKVYMKLVKNFLGLQGGGSNLDTIAYISKQGWVLMGSDIMKGKVLKKY